MLASWGSRHGRVLAPPPGRGPDLGILANPVSTIAVFTLSSTEEAIRSPLRLFDARGRLVAEIDQWRAASRGIRAEWDGTSGAGVRVAAGVYVGVVETVDGIRSGRVVWLR